MPEPAARRTPPQPPLAKAAALQSPSVQNPCTPIPSPFQRVLRALPSTCDHTRRRSAPATNTSCQQPPPTSRAGSRQRPRGRDARARQGGRGTRERLRVRERLSRTAGATRVGRGVLVSGRKRSRPMSRSIRSGCSPHTAASAAPTSPRACHAARRVKGPPAPALLSSAVIARRSPLPRRQREPGLAASRAEPHRRTAADPPGQTAGCARQTWRGGSELRRRLRPEGGKCARAGTTLRIRCCRELVRRRSSGWRAPAALSLRRKRIPSHRMHTACSCIYQGR